MPYPSVEQLLPHGPPLRLIDSILGEVDEGVICRVDVGEEFVFLRDGEAELVVCVELVAQAIGCLAGLRDHRSGQKPKPGLLLGCRDARFEGAPLRPGDQLTVTAKSQWVREPIASFTGSVERRGERIAEVEIMVIATDGDPRKLARGFDAS